MKIQVNNLCLFHTLSDICPDPTTTLRRIFFDYVVDSKGRFVTSDNKVIETSFPKIEELYQLLNLICKELIVYGYNIGVNLQEKEFQIWLIVC